jgi:hypothetical protein
MIMLFKSTGKWLVRFVMGAVAHVALVWGATDAEQMEKKSVTALGQSIPIDWNDQ